MTRSAFRAARFIPDAVRIPKLDTRRRIYLLRTRQAYPADLHAGGAKPDGRAWYIERESDVDLDVLDPFLPQIARRVIIPNVVDLIPETSWCASLANLLTSSAWNRVRSGPLLRAGGCEDCGSRDKIECHEIWTYDEDRGVQRLQALRAVCADCHETYHLGLASVRGRYSLALGRLMLINRLDRLELREFEDEIFDKFNRRSEIDWTLDLSIIAGMGLELRPSFEEVAPNVLIGECPRGEIQASFLGVELTAPRPGRLTIS